MHENFEHAPGVRALEDFLAEPLLSPRGSALPLPSWLVGRRHRQALCTGFSRKGYFSCVSNYLLPSILSRTFKSLPPLSARRSRTHSGRPAPAAATACAPGHRPARQSERLCHPDRQDLPPQSLRPASGKSVTTTKGPACPRGVTGAEREHPSPAGP